MLEDGMWKSYLLLLKLSNMNHPTLPERIPDWWSSPGFHGHSKSGPIPIYMLANHFTDSGSVFRGLRGPMAQTPMLVVYMNSIELPCKEHIL